jgi:NADH-quinone oxidoreductase subunit M
MFQRVMHGPITNNKILTFKDINKREIAYLVPIVIMMFWMGIYPKPFLRKMDSSVTHLLNRVNKKESSLSQTQIKQELPIEIENVTAQEKNKEKEEETK